jgi:hypothetical protein
MIGRRPFLIGNAGLAAIPATLASKPAAGLPAPAAWADATEAEGVVLRMHGWDAVEDSSTSAHGQAWVHVDSSWRAAWR